LQIARPLLFAFLLFIKIHVFRSSYHSHYSTKVFAFLQVYYSYFTIYFWIFKFYMYFSWLFCLSSAFLSGFSVWLFCGICQILQNKQNCCLSKILCHFKARNLWHL